MPKRLRLALLAGLLLIGLAPASIAQPSRAERQQRLVDRATLAAQDILESQANGDQARRFLARAHGVMICPSIFRMSFLFGGSGGGCVLLARDGAGSWSAPAFYSMGSGSFGLQAGIQDAEVMLFIMTRRGLNAIMDSHFKFGADASLTFATLGVGMEGATTAALRADIVAVAVSSGLFAGIALQGSVLSFDGPGNAAYYGQPVGVEDIAVAMRVNNPGADPLRAVLMRYGQEPSASAYPAPYHQGGGYSAPNGSPDVEPSGRPTQLAPSGGSSGGGSSGDVQTQSLPPPH